MTLFADGHVPVIKMKDQFRCLHRLYWAFLIHAPQQRVDQFQVFLPDAACHKPGGPYPCEAERKDVHQEPADKLICIKIHVFPCVGGSIVILITEANAVVIIAFDPAVGDGGAVRISGKL